jgi:hypothetical protein
MVGVASVPAVWQARPRAGVIPRAARSPSLSPSIFERSRFLSSPNPSVARAPLPLPPARRPPSVSPIRFLAPTPPPPPPPSVPTDRRPFLRPQPPSRHKPPSTAAASRRAAARRLTPLAHVAGGHCRCAVPPVRVRSRPASRWVVSPPLAAAASRRVKARLRAGRVAGVHWPRPCRVKATAGLDSAWGGAGCLGPPVGAQGH